MCSAIGLRQSVSDVRQSDAGRRACCYITALAISIVRNLDSHGLAFARAQDWGTASRQLSAALGRIPQGIALLDDALLQIDKSGQRWCEATLLHIKSELQAQILRGGIDLSRGAAA